MNKVLFGISFLILTLLISCQNEEKDKTTLISQKEKKQKKEMLKSANKGLLKVYDQRVDGFAKRRKWNLIKTETGFWYEIYKQGNGPAVETGKEVSLDYTLMLLDCTVCYTSDSLGVKRFLVGQGGVESGLEEAVLHLHEGDKARIVLPPYKAWGVPGDGDKIPALSIIVYIVEVVKVHNEE